MATAKVNAMIKALKAHMAIEKKIDSQTLLEYDMAFQTNNKRGHVFDQAELKALYSRNSWCEGEKSGATKICHIDCHNGNSFKYIVVKRFKLGGWVPTDLWCPTRERNRNQLYLEIEAWQALADTDDADYLCPTLKYFTSKSDKVREESEKGKDNVLIIAQKAVKVGNPATMCAMAEEMNYDAGLYCTDAQTRYNELERFASRMGWRDCMRNPANCGVIFDYSASCYKAVFIDYAL